MNVPIGVGVETTVSGVGVGDSTARGVGAWITRAVGVRPSSGVSMTSATSWFGSSVAIDVWSDGIGVVAGSDGVGESTIVGAAMEVHRGGLTF
jgi:hypothetical protein